MTLPACLRARLAFSAVVLTVAGLLPLLASAQTAVSGTIGGDTRWTASDSPYLLSGEVAVQGGATLSIDPGVTVYMAAGARLTVQAGAVRAVGTAALPIRVLSDKTRQGQAGAPGDWDQWVFGSGTTNTRLEQMVFEHGKGLAIHGSAPVLNHVDIRNQQGAAITVDLAASPSGVGNRASGNALNGIAVPAGDVTGSVRWGLRGIPYVITAGSVSVGASPSVGGVSPATVEQGQTVTLTVNGTRLTGLASASFDRAGLTLTPFSGGSSSQLFLQLKVDAAAVPGTAALRLQVDAGELLLPNAISVTAPMPAITALDPSTVLAGAGASEITVTGRNFAANSELTFNAAAVPTVVIGSTQLRGTLPGQPAPVTLQAQVRTPDAARPGQYLLSNAVALPVQAPVPPTVAIEPTPIALPPDGKARDITIRLSKADYRDNTLSLSVSDTSKATVTPASLVIPAGQTSAKITIVPKLTGTVTLTADSATLARISVPLFITADFRGANTAYASPVGVVVQSNTPPATRQVTAVNAMVGVAVGGVLSQVAPRSWAVGSSTEIAIAGAAIPAGAQVSVLPATGIVLGPVTVNAQASELRVTLTTAADAPIGARKLVVRDAAGKELVFANPAASVVQLMTGLPSIESIEPIFGSRGNLLKLVVRGRHLQQGQLRLVPDTGLHVDSTPVVSPDGSMLTAPLQIDADAPTGNRLVQVVTPSGASAAVLSAANTFTVASAVRETVTPVASRLVGVVVGTASPPAEPVQRQPASSLIGVLLGTGITEVRPNTGVVGTTTTVIVRGAGLQAVSGVSVTPAAGVTMGTPTVNGDGTQLSVDITVDAGAALGARRLTLTAAGKPVTFSRPGDGSFLVSAPVPELTAVAPQVLLAGQPAVTLTVRGRNFTNVSAVRIEPSQGVQVQSFQVNADGMQLTVNATVAAGAAPGSRAVVVTTAAGESTPTVQPGNLVRIATQVGPTYAGILSLPVGVRVGSGATLPTDPVNRLIGAPHVGVVVGSATPAPQSINGTAASKAVGVVVGAAAQAISPTGWLQGASGTVTINGRGLDTVTTVSATPATGLLLGAPVVNGDGSQLSLTLSVAPDAPLGLRWLSLGTAAGRTVTFANPALAAFGIGSLPTMTSVSPIVFEQGKGAMLLIRGSNLKNVLRVVFAPGSGLRPAGDIAWSQDALGELLSVAVTVDATAPLGNSVVRLEVYGGLTSAAPSPANTINVVAPQ
ncbi:IPT/TIG domain-containing protein [Rhizobacter sp. SG703]|uniref:IPT/TIG domain-containing protein n=1 Tax=Rhizobacter sp. SG703 TaxID=2587140 RepID=UPI0014476E5E|nr:IPT/TIG domain-containing protein [Rhizobacter sp. SG703]NKI95409.1 hypothetical protein [Rhizobacter sp. SG703]